MRNSQLENKSKYYIIKNINSEGTFCLPESIRQNKFETETYTQIRAIKKFLLDNNYIYKSKKKKNCEDHILTKKGQKWFFSGR